MPQSLSALPKTGTGGKFTSPHSAPYRLWDKAILSCRTGYKVPVTDLSTVMYVQGQLAWDPPELYCEPISQLQELPKTGKGGTFICTRRSGPYHIGDTAVLECSEGYTRPKTVQSIVNLKNGKLVWSPGEIDCIPVRCPQPVIPVHGKTSNTNYYFAQFFSYVCDAGYRLKPETAKTYYCMPSGVWSPALDKVECQPVKCPPLQAPDHGSLTSYTTTLGSVATFKCDRNYAMFQGQTTRKCQEDGTWSGLDVICDKKPCPPIPSSVTAIRLEGFAMVTCDQGEIVNVKCLPTGQWSLQFPYCDKIPTVPMMPQNVYTAKPPPAALPGPRGPVPLPAPPHGNPPSRSAGLPLPNPSGGPVRSSNYALFYCIWILFVWGLMLWILSQWNQKD